MMYVYDFSDVLYFSLSMSFSMFEFLKFEEKSSSVWKQKCFSEIPLFILLPENNLIVFPGMIVGFTKGMI